MICLWGSRYLSVLTVSYCFYLILNLMSLFQSIMLPNEIQVFGRDCLRAVGYNENSADFVIDNKIEINNFVSSPKVECVKIKQHKESDNKNGNILDVLNISPREFVSFES